MKGTHTYGCGHTAYGYPPSERIMQCIDCYRKAKRERQAGMTTDEIREERQERADRKAVQLRRWAGSHRRKSEEYARRSDSISGMIPMGQPVLVGHHSERGHRRDLSRMHSYESKRFEHSDIADKYDRRADALERGVAVKGDAERKRQKMREELDRVITVGTAVTNCWHGVGEVKRVNKKTYTILFEKYGRKHAIEKTFVKKLERNKNGEKK